MSCWFGHSWVLVDVPVNSRGSVTMSRWCCRNCGVLEPLRIAPTYDEIQRDAAARKGAKKP